jgi:hypothetical protein
MFTKLLRGSQCDISMAVNISILYLPLMSDYDIVCTIFPSFCKHELTRVN